jgi:hypothetical protein
LTLSVIEWILSMREPNRRCKRKERCTLLIEREIRIHNRKESGKRPKGREKEAIKESNSIRERGV